MIEIAPSKLIQGLRTLPESWALTPLQDKSPKRRGWQTEPPISRAEMVELLHKGHWTGYGLRTGETSGGLIAIDVDGSSAEPLLHQVSGGELPNTVSWTSGKSGKRQLLYQLPEKVQEQLQGFNRSVLKEWQGLKCNSGELLEFRYNRCQSALPPSKHPDTEAYYWLNSPVDVEVAIAPQWLCELLIQLANQEKLAEEQRQQNRLESDPTGDPFDIRNFAQYLDSYKLNGRRGWDTCKCPAHNGNSDNSLHIEQSTGAYKCHAECDPKTIYTAALELAIARGHQVPKNGQRQSQGGWLYSIRKHIQKALKSCYRFDRTGAVELEPEKQPDPVIEYNPGDRLQTWIDAVNKGARHILDQSGTGSAKSFDSGRVEPAMFDAAQVFYLSPQHRNPTVVTLEISNGWVDLEARHGGLTWEIRPNGETRRRRAKKGDSYVEPPNCSRNGVINKLREKNVNGADSAPIVCGTCSLKEACNHDEGPGYGFLAQRRDALASPKVRLHPDSIPDPSNYDLSQTVALWDEMGEQGTIQKIQVTLDDLRQTISQVAMGSPTTFEQLQPLFHALLPLLDGSTKLGKYGFYHAATLEALPTDLSVDLVELENLLAPDLDFLNTTASYGVDLGDLPSQLRKRFSDRDPDAAEKAAENVVKQWLPELLRVLIGEQCGSLQVVYDRRQKIVLLSITLLNSRPRAIAQATKANIYLDATLTREALAQQLGISPDEILVIRQKQPQTDNLEIVQVAGLGRLGMQRGKDQQKRANAIIAHYKADDPTTKVIDFKKFSQSNDGRWWIDSRGSNDFQKVNTLVLVGVPCRNLGDLEAEFAVLYGLAPKGGTETVRRAIHCKHPLAKEVQAYFESEESADPGFREFIRHKILADTKQAIGRLRAHLRPNEDLRVIILGDFAFDFPVTLINAGNITPEAASKTERVTAAIKQAVATLKEQGKKITQQAIAEITGLSQGYVSRFRKLLQTLLGSYSKSNNPETEEPPIELVAVVEEAIALSKDHKQVLETLNEVFFLWLKPSQWYRFWENLGARTQIKALRSLALTLSPNELRQLYAGFS